MTDLISRVKKALERIDDGSTAILQANMWEHYFTAVAPQPMGTPKTIFRMGYAKGSHDESARTEKLVEALVKFVRFSEQKEYRHPDEILALNELKVALEEIERKDVLDETIEAVKRIDKQKARNKDNI